MSSKQSTFKRFSSIVHQPRNAPAAQFQTQCFMLHLKISQKRQTFLIARNFPPGQPSSAETHTGKNTNTDPHGSVQLRRIRAAGGGGSSPGLGRLAEAGFAWREPRIGAGAWLSKCVGVWVNIGRPLQDPSTHLALALAGWPWCMFPTRVRGVRFLLGGSVEDPSNPRLANREKTFGCEFSPSWMSSCS